MFPILDSSTPGWRLPTLGLATVALLGGCASYQPRPLPEQAGLAQGIDGLRADIDAQRHAGLGVHEINPADGLDLTEIAILAVLNNPDLKARRAQLSVAGAQLFAAGLLPDPQIAANLDRPTGNTAGLVNAWGLGMGYDLVPLITRQAHIDAERQGQHQVRLDLLWQEWQVVQRARSLAVRYTLEKQRLELLRDMSALYQTRYRRSAAGLSEGNVTLDVNGTDLTALVDAFSQINQLEQTHNETRHSLSLLLGLQADADIPLAPLKNTIPLDEKEIRERLRDLPKVRPDLLALRAGYESQEAKVRAAVLAQFPSLGIGITRARDTGNLYTTGFNISLNLPLFAGNRGAISVERATREQLREEYRARLAQSTADLDRLSELQNIIQRHRITLDTYLPRLKALVRRARRAYRQGDIDALTFLNMESTWVNKRLERIGLEQSQWENRIALETLLALPGGWPSPAAGAADDTQPKSIPAKKSER